MTFRFICNTSGSGKTRRLMEGLSQHWGFYFVAAPDTNSVGVSDMKEALESVQDYPSWTEDREIQATAQRATCQSVNKGIANNAFMKVLAARVVVFEHFLELAVKTDGYLQEKHKHAWLMFQISNVLDRSDIDRHPFIDIIVNCLVGAKPGALRKIVERLDEIRGKYFHPDLHFFFVLDEAQVAARSSPRAFMSSKDPSKFQALFREIIRLWVNLGFLQVKFILSGTGLSLEAVNEACLRSWKTCCRGISRLSRCEEF
jgi:hypothetical protein